MLMMYVDLFWLRRCDELWSAVHDLIKIISAQFPLTNVGILTSFKCTGSTICQSTRTSASVRRAIPTMAARCVSFTACEQNIIKLKLNGCIHSSRSNWFIIHMKGSDTCSRINVALISEASQKPKAAISSRPGHNSQSDYFVYFCANDL